MQSSEELYVLNFLEEKGFTVEKEVYINNLKDDDKKYRIADFYLPKFKIYVEYFGNYNVNKERRLEYDKKALVYIKNDIPTVFLYPHELGFLDYAFNSKILKILKIKKFNLKKELFRYRLSRYFEKEGLSNLLILIFSVIGLIASFNSHSLKNNLPALIALISLLAILMSVGYFIRDILKYFFKKNN